MSGILCPFTHYLREHSIQCRFYLHLPEIPAFDAPFTLTTHLFPATYLRTTRQIPLPKLPAAGATKEEWGRVLAESALQLLDWSSDTGAVIDGHPLVLWNCVNRYVKKDLNLSNKTGLTSRQWVS